MKWSSFAFKLSIMLVFVNGFIIILHGQDYMTANPSPDGMGSIQNITSNVNHCTGVVNLQVPLCGVDYAGIQVPVTLNYQTSGIKVDAEETCVGLGWNLSAGGKITRIVKKYPDESTAGFLNHTRHSMSTVENYVFARSGSKPSNSKYKNYNDFDGEPDLFYFDLPGKSGIFVFDENGLAHTIPYQSIDIQWIHTEGLNFFIIKTTDGTQYTLGETTESRDEAKVNYENTNLDGKEQFQYISTWHLDKIETHDKRKIRFTYQAGATKTIENSVTATSFKTESKQTDFRNFNIASVLDTKYNKSTTTFWSPKMIYEIRWEFGSIQFNKHYEAERIRNITNYLNGASYTITLDYTMLARGDATIDKIYKTRNGISKLICAFEYNRVINLPDRKTNNYDYWGYFNGKNNTSHYYSTFRAFTNDGNLATFYGADREPSEDHTKANILTDILYPEGGRASYEYELNEINDYGGNKTLGGLRVRKIIYTDEDGKKTATSYIYKRVTWNRNSWDDYSSGVGFKNGFISDPYHIYAGYIDLEYWYTGLTCYGVSFSKPINSLYDITGSHVIYSSITEIAPDESRIIYDYSTYVDEGCRDEFFTVHYKRGWGVIRTNWEEDVDLQYNIVPTSRFWRQKLLLRETHLKKEGTEYIIIMDKKYHYNSPSQSKGRINAYSLFFQKDNDHGDLMSIDEYRWISEPLYLKSIEILPGSYNLSSMTEFEYDENMMVPLIEKTTTAGTTIENRTKYLYQFQIPVLSADAPETSYAMKSMQEKGMCIIPIETISYKNGKVVGAEINTFKYNNDFQKFIVPSEQKVFISETPHHSFDTANFVGQAFIYNQNYERVKTVLEYDQNFNILTVENDNGPISQIFDRFSRPIATISQARHAPLNLIRKPTEESRVLPINIFEQPESYNHRFDSPYAQTVTLKVKLHFTNVNAPSEMNPTWSISTYISGPGVQHSCWKSSGFPWEEYIGWSEYEIALGEGTYDFQFNINFATSYPDLHDGVELEFCIESELLAPSPNSTQSLNHRNQVFYTSFEDNELFNMEYSMAKTGKRVRNGSYFIDLRNFAPGEYVVSYWTRSINEVNWTRKTDTFTLEGNNSRQYYTINNEGMYLDEVWVIPHHARINTCTYDTYGNKISKTDHNGLTNYYEYDYIGRLTAIRDDNRNLIESVEYNF